MINVAKYPRFANINCLTQSRQICLMQERMEFFCFRGQEYSAAEWGNAVIEVVNVSCMARGGRLWCRINLTNLFIEDFQDRLLAPELGRNAGRNEFERCQNGLLPAPPGI